MTNGHILMALNRAFHFLFGVTAVFANGTSYTNWRELKLSFFFESESGYFQ